jgi:hypothetical protein
VITVSPEGAREWLLQCGSNTAANSILFALIDTEELNPGQIFVWLGVESGELFYSLTPLGEGLFEFAVNNARKAKAQLN